jgi:sodium/pantothenate symporter
MMFPDLMFQGKPLPLDGIMSTYVVERFSTGAGVLVIFGLLAAGMSTLESLIQSLSITITQDLVRPILGKRADNMDLNKVNRKVIIGLAVITLGKLQPAH